MKKSRLIFYMLTALMLVAGAVNAQETIMNDISYPYLEKLINTAKQNYQQVKIKQDQVNIAKNGLTTAQLSWFTAFSGSYTYNPSNTLNVVKPNIFLGYQLGVSVNLGTLIQTPFTIRSARESYKIAQLDQQSFLATLEDEVRKRYFTYLAQLASLRLRTKSSQDAEYLLTQSRHQFEKGVETIDNYTKASGLFADNNQAKINAEAAVLIAKSSLEEIVGKKLEDVK